MAVSDQDLEDALGIAAKMIDLYGYKYWPIFERLEAELDARAERIKRVQARLRRKTVHSSLLKHTDGKNNVARPSS